MRKLFLVSIALFLYLFSSGQKSASDSSKKQFQLQIKNIEHTTLLILNNIETAQYSIDSLKKAIKLQLDKCCEVKEVQAKENSIHSINYFGIIKDILLTLLGGFLAVIITDFIKKPKLEIKFTPGGHNNFHSYLIATISNKPFNFFGIKIDREAAINCSAALHINNDMGHTELHGLKWEIKLSSAFERCKTIYTGVPEKLRVIGVVL